MHHLTVQPLKHLYLNQLRLMSKIKNHIKYFTVFFILLALTKTQCQDSNLVKTIALKSIDKVTHDKFFNFYITTSNGQIYKYDKYGNFLLFNSPIKPQTINNIEATNTIRVFCFYKELQEFNYFDRFLTFDNSIKLDPQVIGFAKIATISSDNTIWIFDESDYNLKKYDPVLQKTLQNVNCNLLLKQGDHNISYMKEYQNKLYMLDKDSGVFIFDNMGNFNKYIELPDVHQLSFYADHMFALCNNKLYKINLYDILPAEEQILIGTYSFFFYSEEHIYLFNNEGYKIIKQ